VPWSALNVFLADRFAFPPDVSCVTRDAISIAVSIKHQAESVAASRIPSLAAVEPELRRGVVDAGSFANKLMSDVADAAKHQTSLRKAGRKNTLRVEAAFEYDAMNRFRFLRNQIAVTHATHGEFDFMVESASAIRYWLKNLGIRGPWDGTLALGKNEFYQTAFLYYHPDHQVVMKRISLSFHQRASSGELVLGYPPEIIFAVYDHPSCGAPATK